LYGYAAHRDLPSFPTRRSSDLDQAVDLVATSVGGRLHTVDLPTGTVVAHPTAGPAYDPRPSRDGRRISYVVDDALHLLELVAGTDRKSTRLNSSHVKISYAVFC